MSRHRMIVHRLILALGLSGAMVLPVFATDLDETERAESAWGRGDHAEAAAVYRSILAKDSHAVRATFRLGLLASWRDDLPTALLLLQRARILDASDIDIRLAEARILSWMSRADAALALYDSILVRSPDLREALLGRARTLSWAGRLPMADSAYALVASSDPEDIIPILGRAEVATWGGDPHRAMGFYSEALAVRPEDPDALTGFARARLREGRPRDARAAIARALASDSTHRGALALQGDVRSALRPRIDVGFAWSEDSDGNITWSQSGTSSLWLATGLTASASAGAFDASDPARHATRQHGELGLSLARGAMQWSGALGVRSLRPDGLPIRSLGSGRAVVTRRMGPSISMSADWTRSPLDETAVLIARGLSASSVGASLEATLASRIGLSASVGSARLDDGNRRSNWLTSVETAIPHRLRLGVLARELSYARRGQGYYSPDRFRLIEGRLSRNFERGFWSGRLSGGLGGQQTASTADPQVEWHVEGRIARRWRAIDQIDVFFGLSEGGWRSESGAYRHRTIGASLRLGL